MDLTLEQNAAVVSDIKDKLLLAGPGTGKSFTILGYLIYLIVKKSVNPKNIYILTFTRAATHELKIKIKKELSLPELYPNVFTLHGFALRQLVKNNKNIKSLPNAFSIADDFEERHVIIEDLKRYLKLDVREIKKLIALLASNWETLNADTQDWESKFDNPEFLGAWKEHREIYGYVLRAELVYQLKNMFDTEPDCKIDGPIEYLIVDEYQDLNRCDLNVIYKLHDKGACLFSAGDDDQSIYGFRYAHPEGIRRFTNDIKGSQKFEITECKRCDDNILKLALDVIGQDHRRIKKNLKSVSGNKGQVHFLQFDNQQYEADKIADIILELKVRNISFSDIIILLRTDRHGGFSKVIENSLLSKGIPIGKKLNEFDIFESNQGIAFIALMKFLQSDKNDLSIRTLLQQTKGLAEGTIDKIYNIAKESKSRFSSVVHNIASNSIKEFVGNTILFQATQNIYKFRNENEKNDNLNDLLDSVLTLDSIFDMSFIVQLKEFIKITGISSKDELVNEINDIIGPAEQAQYADGIRIMTMHQAKGLTAVAAFVAACEDEYIPGDRDIDEERRLLYVSLTRAMNYLFITFCKERTGQQTHTGTSSGNKIRHLSSFFKGIPSLMVYKGNNFILP